MNIVKLQDSLKDLSDRQLLDTMQTASAPQYLVLAEMQRRKELRSGAERQQQQGETSVAEEIMGGIASMPVQGVAPQMASGGIVAFAGGGSTKQNDNPAYAYAKGSKEGCWEDPSTGKLDCPGKPDLRMPKKLAEGGAIGFANQGYVDPRLLMLDPEEREQIMKDIESGNRQLDSEGNIVTSKKGALGRFQVMPATAAEPGYGMKNIFELADERGISNYGEGEDEAARLLEIPELNADMGREYKRGLTEMFGEQGAVPAYNMGPGAYKKFLAGQQGMPEETQDYVAKTNEGIQQVLDSRNAEQTIADLGYNRGGLGPGENQPTLKYHNMPTADADPADIAEYLRKQEDMQNVAKALAREEAQTDAAGIPEAIADAQRAEANRLAQEQGRRQEGLEALIAAENTANDPTDMTASADRENAYMQYLDLKEKGLFDGTFEQFYGKPDDLYEASQAGLPPETRPPVIAPKAEGIQTQLPDDMPPTPPVVSDGRTELSRRLLQGFGGPASEQELKDIRARNRAEYGIDDFDRMIRESGEAPAPEKAPEQSMQKLSAEETLKYSDRLQRELPPPPEDDPDALASWSREAAKLLGDDPTDAAVNAMVYMYGFGAARKALGLLGKGEKWVRSKLVKVPKDYKGLGPTTKGGTPYKNKNWAETAAKELEKATGKAHKVVKSGDGFKVIPTAKGAYGPAATAVGKGLKAIALPAAMTGMYAANEWRKMTPEQQQAAIDSFNNMFGSSAAAPSAPAATSSAVTSKPSVFNEGEAQTATGAAKPAAPQSIEEIKKQIQIKSPTSVSDATAPAAGSFYDRLNKGLQDDNVSTGLMAAGLGMMASKDPNFFGALGEGGIKGLSAYTKLQEAQKDREIKRFKELADIAAAQAMAGYRSGSLDVDRAKLLEAKKKNLLTALTSGAGAIQFNKQVKELMDKKGVSYSQAVDAILESMIRSAEQPAA